MILSGLSMPLPPDRTQGPSAEQIDAILPQTQCQQCSYAGCRPYAEAIAAGQDEINRCPPGGDAGIRKLAALTGRSFIPFAADAPQPKPRALALIDEDNCIGCTLCIQACPVDAILGAAKLMHTVIADECTGCELCVAPCPVDAIQMQPPPEQNSYNPDHARARYQFHQERHARELQEKAQRRAAPAAKHPSQPSPAASPQAPNTLDEQKKAVIAAAMRRAAEKQAARGREGQS
jgi:electron transport complex protein RnfB